MDSILTSIDSFEFLKNHRHARRCFGLIIDGDMAVKWKEDREGGRHASVCSFACLLCTFANVYI